MVQARQCLPLRLEPRRLISDLPANELEGDLLLILPIRALFPINLSHPTAANQSHQPIRTNTGSGRETSRLNEGERWSIQQRILGLHPREE